MNRANELTALMAQLNETPPALEFAIARARARARKSQQIRKFFIMPASSVAVIFIAFVALVNLSTPFAMACERIPILRELAAAVSFSPSLSTAVENDYVQIIGQEQTENGITMRVEYVIVDQKQLNIFYVLQSKEYFHMDAAPDILDNDGQRFGGYALSAPNSGYGNDDIRQIVVDFIDNDVPDSLMLECRVHDNGSYEISAPVKVGEESQETGEPHVIATFSFLLSFDPEYTQQGETITINQDIVLDGQRLTVTNVEIYPTHSRVNFTADDSNTAWIQSLDFYFINDEGDRFDPISNGISATGSVDSPMMASHRLESPFFYQSNRLTMYITNVIWLDKDMERVRVDLANMVADALPESVVFEQATRKGNSWELVFSAIERDNGSSYQLFGNTYYDDFGNEFRYNSWSTGMTGYYDETIGEYVDDDQGRFRVKFTLDDFPYDFVYLAPSYSRTVELEAPISVSIK